MTDELLNLARGPDGRVTRYTGCMINGFRYRTQDREIHQKTQNSGVVVKGDHQGQSIDFYGIIRDVIELSYLGRNQVLIFRCDWWDVGSARGKLVDENNFTSINITKTWYKDEPFVLACQAEQVLYLKDTVNGDNWRVVQKLFPRAVYDIPEEEEEESEEDEPFQEDESFGLSSGVEVNNESLLMQRDDMDFVRVDVNNILHDEEEEENDDNFINDDDDMLDIEQSDNDFEEEDDLPNTDSEPE